MWWVLDSMADALLSTTASWIAILVRIPLMSVLAFVALWTLVRGVASVVATILPTLGRIFAHLVWYALLWPEMRLGRWRGKRSLEPTAVQYVYGDQVDLLARVIKWMFAVVVRCLTKLSLVSNGVLVGFSVLWAVSALLMA